MATTNHNIANKTAAAAADLNGAVLPPSEIDLVDGASTKSIVTEDSIEDQQQQPSSDGLQPEDIELNELNNFINDLEQKITLKCQLRQKNVNCVRPSESHFSRLDSSLKKNTAFVKKLKQFTTVQLDQLLKDMKTLNLTKYISEISSALVEAKLKITDVPAAIVICSELHQIYAEFSSTFLENWQKVLTIKSGEKIANPSKMRVDLRYFAEIVAVGIISNKAGLALLGQTLTNLIAQDKEEHNNLSIILPFCRHCGEEYAGLIPRIMTEYSIKYNRIIPRSTLLSADKQQNLLNLLKDYYGALSKHLTNQHDQLQNYIRVNRKIMETKGEVSAERKEKQETLQNNFDKLLVSAQTMSELLNESMVIFSKHDETLAGGVICDNDDLMNSQLDPWGDEETKSFYVDLPDLHVFLPNYAPKNLPKTETPTITEDILDMDNIDANDIEIDESAADDIKRDSPETVIEETQPIDVTLNNKTNDMPASANTSSTINQTTTTATTTTATTTTTTTAISAKNRATKAQFEEFLHNLTKCVNKEACDNNAIEFLLNLNTKPNRKKLAKVLFGVQRTRLDLLPFFARLTAIINLVSQEVTHTLNALLKHEFRFHLVKKNQVNIESKIKVMRFIGEMVKFNLFPVIDSLFFLKLLLMDFQHHQIDMTCAFLEVAGRYLYNSKDSRIRTNVYLEQMLRLKMVQALDSRHSAQIENVYYLVKPPDMVQSKEEPLPIVYQYVQHLIFEELDKHNVSRIIRILKRINWNDEELNKFTVNCLSKAYNLRYHVIRCLADVVSGISACQKRVASKVVDTVFEDIRAGIEIHSPKLAQRRIAMAKYLAELYNYQLVDSSNILNTLYMIISFGVTFDNNIISETDPPDSLFRLKLACVLLDACSQYFVSSRKKLDYFLIFFQHYYWFKKSHPIFSSEGNRSDLFPILVDHLYLDCIFKVRPKLKLFKSYEEAQIAVERLRLKVYPNLFSTKSDGAGDGDSTNNVRLDTIAEDIEQDVTVNELTERDTSESYGDDDDDDDDDGGDGEGEGEEDGGDVDPINDDNDNDEDGDNDENDYDDDEDDDNDVDFRETTNNECKREIIKTQEDLEFEQAFEKLSMDSYQERLRDTVKPSAKDIPVPMKVTKLIGANAVIAINTSLNNNNNNVIGTANNNNNINNNAAIGRKPFDPSTLGGKLTTGNAPQKLTNDPIIDDNQTVPFVLMVRSSNTKSNKQQFKTFKAPIDSQLAINLRLQEQKIREENEKVKRLTLNITERIAEEDYQESLLQSQRSPAQNRTQKTNKLQKFKHQKGVPDADLIFG